MAEEKEGSDVAIIPQKPAAQRPAPMIVHDDSPLAYMLDTAKFEHLYRIAGIIARASLTPKHLKAADQAETVANCFRVVNQAMRWGMDPFAVVDATYVVAGKLGYEGKLVAAVVNARAGLKGRLIPSYKGDGPNRTVIVSGHFADEAQPRTIELSVTQARTQNKMWDTDPDQKLWYTGVTKWARRHCPEILLGVMSDDDLEAAKNERISGAQAALEKLNGAAGHRSATLPPTDGAATDAHAEEKQPTQSPPAKDEKQDDPAKPMDNDQSMLIADEMQRVGKDQVWLAERCKAVGKRFQKLSYPEADGIIAELRDLPSKGEEAATAPTSRRKP